MKNFHDSLEYTMNQTFASLWMYTSKYIDTDVYAVFQNQKKKKVNFIKTWEI